MSSLEKDGTLDLMAQYVHKLSLSTSCHNKRGMNPPFFSGLDKLIMAGHLIRGGGVEVTV